MLGAEPFACGCCHLLRPALSISSHLPSPGPLSWGRRGLGVTDPLCGCSRHGREVLRGAEGTPCMAPSRQVAPTRAPKWPGEKVSCKATLQCHGGEVLSPDVPSWLESWPDELCPGFATLPCAEVQAGAPAPTKTVTGAGWFFSEVDVKCCVFTGSAFILKPEETG